MQQIWHFIMHLRWHYQVFILSGGYLLGGVLSPEVNWAVFSGQFLNVHLLLFGGATAYNSYWDKDEGPIGGLQHPPPMQRWMWGVSLLLQFAGLGWALQISYTFGLIYLLSILFFWLYSSPHFRWKGNPIRSLVAIGVSTGCNSVFLGYLAASPETLSFTVVTAALGVMLMVLSLYPVSQVYQLDEDKTRGDFTFVMKFGVAGVIQFFAVAFVGGVILVSFAVFELFGWVSAAFMMLGLVMTAWIYSRLKELVLEREDYRQVMKIKYYTSLSFVILLITLLSFKYAGIWF